MTESISIHKQRTEWLARRCEHLELEDSDFIYFNGKVSNEVLKSATEIEARNIVFLRYFS